MRPKALNSSSLLCSYFRQSEIRTPFDSTQYQRLKYEHSSDTTMFVCVRIFVEFVFQSHPAQEYPQVASDPLTDEEFDAIDFDKNGYFCQNDDWMALLDEIKAQHATDPDYYLDEDDNF